MSYERKDIPALIKLFKSAKERLTDTARTKFLCHALEDSTENQALVETAKSLVGEAISGHYTLSMYYSFDYKKGYPRTRSGEIELRRMWCDKIIHDLKEYAK